MSQTTQIISIPLVEGKTSVKIASSAWGVGGAKVEAGRIAFEAGPDLVTASSMSRIVLVRPVEETIPRGYKSAGKITHNNNLLEVLVELP